MAAQRKQASASASPNIGENLEETKSLHFEFEPFNCQPGEITTEDKVLFVDRELRKLQTFCVQSGYSAAQVECFAECFNESSSKVLISKWKRRGVGVVLFAVACLLLHQFDPACRLAAATARSGVIKLLPVWDWTELYHSTCLFTNPLYRDPNRLFAEDCQVCEGVQNIRRVRGLNAADVVEQYFKRDLPIIVEDGLHDWDAQSMLTIHDLAHIYETDDVLKSSGGCGFSSNIRSKHGGHRDLLHKILRENLTEFYAHWENCQLSAAKAFRWFYKQPYFLPYAVETSPSNWVFISSNYVGKLFKVVEIDHPLVMLMQIRGQVEIQVEAWNPCDKVCAVLSDILHEGETLVVTEFLWKTAYLPVTEHESVTIGIGGSFD
ncbi:hypothetical protein BaRGS_00001937 [Batillaria attramentaria]|uniref:Uncharacterized protein n=1 Tax=Batillaria attramentaria TaxID=370345 RepID=A0ABD0M5P0_9CAEN